MSSVHAACDAGAVSLGLEDPRSDDARDLYDEMGDFVEAVYPEDAENGVIPSTPDALAAAGMFVVARVDGAAAGCGALVPIDGEEWSDALEVKCMFVRSTMRGRRIADQVLRRLEAMARNRGAMRLLLQCGPRQPEALRLYDRNGFSVRNAYARHKDHPLSIFLEKKLAPETVR